MRDPLLDEARGLLADDGAAPVVLHAGSGPGVDIAIAQQWLSQHVDGL